MLVLTRRVRQQIVINDQIVLTVVETARGHVRIGFEAPATCTICRREAYIEPLPEVRPASAESADRHGPS